MFRKILLPVALEDEGFSDRAADVAVEHARKYGASLHVFSVLPGFGSPWVSTYFPVDAFNKAKADLQTNLQRWVEAHMPDDVEVTFDVGQGTPYKEILAEAERVHADLIIIASHDAPAWDRVLLGSCAAKVVEHAHISVMVIRAPRARRP